MKTVEVAELKEDLDRYLNQAHDGERVLITAEGRQIAQLLPASTAERVIRSLEQAHKAVWTGGKPAGIRGVRAVGKSVSSAVLEGRR